MKGLHGKLTVQFFLVASSVLLLSGVILAARIHHHVVMFEAESAHQQHSNTLGAHLESAILESLLFIAIGAVIVVYLLSYYAAKRFSKPLIAMKDIAVKIARGNRDSFVQVKGNDEVSELAEALNFLAAELNEQEKLRKNMTVDISHELRTPLTTLKSHLEALEDGVWEPTPERFSACTEEINRLIHLVRDLEQLNELDAPDFSICPQESDLTEIISKTIIGMERMFMEKNINLEIDLIPSMKAECDPERMRQIFANLLSNVYKYTNEGGKVWISSAEEKCMIAVSIKDNGRGMSSEAVKRAFERLYREDTSRSRKTGGSGIGLAIVKRLIEAHGGEVWIESKIEAGTTVHIRLPKRQSS